MNGLIALCGILVLLLVIGGLIGAFDRRHFSPKWLLVAAALVVVNDALLTRGWGAFPSLLPGDRNWQGKLLALAATLVIAALPAFGWRRIGLTFRQAPGSLRAALPVVAVYCAFFLALAFAFPNDAPSAEEVAFQLTLPGIEEETFYRGLLLFALGSAFAGRARILGVDWSWGAVLSCLLFGLAHGFGYSDGSYTFDPLVTALTGLPSFIAVWVVLRTGSVLLPILMHNFGNLVFLVL